MSEKLLMKGNEAVAEAAIKAGCRYFFGYPITPQNDIPEYMSRRMPEVGGEYLQAESEVAAINMVHGAAGAGARVMTSSSSPGINFNADIRTYLVAESAAGAVLLIFIIHFRWMITLIVDTVFGHADNFDRTDLCAEFTAFTAFIIDHNFFILHG